jgi:murein L,D-transpeptidase YcbB/YkuD
MSLTAAEAASRVSTINLETAATGDGMLRELYAARRWEPLWFDGAETNGRRAVMLALLEREERLTDTVIDRAARSSTRPQPQPELALTKAAMGYLARRAGGRPVRPALAAELLADLSTPRGGHEFTLALQELRLVSALGGWTSVRLRPAPSVLIPPMTPVRAELDLIPPGTERPRAQPVVPDLRRRLVQSLDLSPHYLEGEELDPAVLEALRRFQERHGLVADGIAGTRTVMLLNGAVSAQIRQVELNIARTQHIDRAGMRRYIEVNIPAFDLKLVDGKRVAYRSRVIVGDEKTPTPIFDDWIRFVELNPSWYVPRSIQHEILDKEAKEPGYMSKAGFVWRGTGEGGSRLVQRPGPENALGQLKFVFPNRHAVYIHDTPNRGLFSSHDRTLSHGCIRLEQPMGLAIALLGSQGWDQPRIELALERTSTRRLPIDAPVPVFLDYRTATLDDEGRLQLWPDIYKLDAKGVVRFPSKGLPPLHEPAPPPPPQPPEATVAVGEPAPVLESGAQEAPQGL